MVHGLPWWQQEGGRKAPVLEDKVFGTNWNLMIDGTGGREEERPGQLLVSGLSSGVDWMRRSQWAWSREPGTGRGGAQSWTSWVEMPVGLFKEVVQVFPGYLHLKPWTETKAGSPLCGRQEAQKA
jgi:hypothetical protein